ncbi:uncharacterized protein LOC114741328 [Neltuma alba]|uniref:uncharacterized protein LOC114741328 n=1 Tax=Neltuma alba TaxID=207710 RepID=UPI0010A48E5E|nr:uncharacterized protein LOC114741328 [Prosopis alba]
MVGFCCIALRPPLQELFEQWNLLRIVVSCIVRFPMNFLAGSLRTAKTKVGFFVVALTSLYCYYGDRSRQGETEEKGYRSTLRLIYFEAFALMSLSLSTQAHSGLKLDTSNFLLICLVLGIIKKNFMAGVVVAVLCYMAMSSLPCSDSRQEQGRRGGGESEDIIVLGDSLLEEAPQSKSQACEGDLH